MDSETIIEEVSTFFDFNIDKFNKYICECLHTKPIQEDAFPNSENWVEILCSPVSAKWSRPVTRINNKPANVMNGIAYRDIQAIAPTLETFFVNFQEKYNEASADHQNLIWKMLDLISLNALFKENVVKTHSPSLSVIRADIEKNKTQATIEVKEDPDEPVKEEEAEKEGTIVEKYADQPPKLTRQNGMGMEIPTKANVNVAIRTLFKQFVDLLAPPPAKSKSSKSKLRNHLLSKNETEVRDAFQEILTPEREQASIDNDLTIFVEANWDSLIDDAVIKKTFLAKLATIALDENVSKTVCTIFNKIFGFIRVESNVPKNMMNQIENVTTGLLGKLKKGEIQMEDIDLDAVSKKVIDKCTQEEQDSVNQNIATLLPMLQRSAGL